MSYISLTQKPIAVKVWEKLRKKNTLNFCIKRILSSYHAKVFHFPRYTSPPHWNERESGCKESVNVKNTWNNIGPKNKFHLYYIGSTYCCTNTKSWKRRQKTLEKTTKIVEIGLKLPLDKNNMKIFILYQSEIEKKMCLSLSSSCQWCCCHSNRQWAIKLKIEIEKFRCASICCFIHIDNK